MGIVVTRYESGCDIKFDVSKFDYRYDDDGFPTDAALDFEQILFEHGDFYVATHSDVTTDSMGKPISGSDTDKTIYGMFQDITIKDRQINDAGLAVPGNRKFYFMPSYDTKSGGVVVDSFELKEGDIIKDNKLYGSGDDTGQWRVIKIFRQWWEPQKEIYRVAVVQNINLDGST